MHVEELHGGELLEDYPRGQTGPALPEQLAQGDAKAIRHESDEDVCLDPPFARRQLGEKPRHLRAAQGFTEDRLAALIRPMHLKNILCQVDPNRRNVHGGRSC
jgi:hypothetical protein